MNPKARLSVDNRTEFAVSVTINAFASGQQCYAGDTARPQQYIEIDDTIGGIECWGATPEFVEFRVWFGEWTCDWEDAKQREPIVFTVDGPACDTYNVSLTPTPDPRTPGLPFSPPQEATPTAPGVIP
jgi:hypothetical protein